MPCTMRCACGHRMEGAQGCSETGDRTGVRKALMPCIKQCWMVTRTIACCAQMAPTRSHCLAGPGTTPAVAGQTLPAADCDEFTQAWAQDTGPTSCLSTDSKRYKVTQTQQGGPEAGRRPHLRGAASGAWGRPLRGHALEGSLTVQAACLPGGAPLLQWLPPPAGAA